jgi:hypothetical protein
MAKRHYKSELMDKSGRRTKEMEESGMIHEDRSAIANMPQTETMKPYPRSEYGLNGDYDDTIRGIDRQINTGDTGKARSIMKPEKI